MDSGQDESAALSQSPTAVSQNSHLAQQQDSAPDPELQDRADSRSSGPTPSHLASSSRDTIDTAVPFGNDPNPVQTPSVQSTRSAASDHQPVHGSQADPSDRVFPIRSVISVGPSNRVSGEYFPRTQPPADGAAHAPGSSRVDTEHPSRRAGSLTSDSVLSSAPPHSTLRGDDPHRRTRSYTTGPRSSVQADAERHTSGPLNLFNDESEDEGEETEPIGDVRSSQYGSSIGQESTSGLRDGALDGLMTSRFKHVMTDDGHLVITGRDGTLQRCEDEPIHAPGAVQGFGLMLAIREEVDGRFTVRYASENSKRIIGYTPLELFRLNNFTDVLTEEQADNLLDHIDFIRDEDADPAINGPEVFSMSIRPPKKRYSPCVFFPHLPFLYFERIHWRFTCCLTAPSIPGRLSPPGPKDKSLIYLPLLVS